MEWSPHDAERLAALLDGRMTAAARRELMADLAEDEELRAVLADAAALAAEMEAEDEEAAARAAADRQPGVVPITARGSRRRRPVVWWTAAAGLVAAAVAAPLLWRAVGSDPLTPAEAVSLLAAPGAGLPAAWEAQPWDAVRAPGEPIADHARGVRLGARLVDLSLAVRAGPAGAAAARDAAAEAANLVRGVPGGSGAAGDLQALAADPAPAPAAADAAARRAAGVVDAAALAEGAWLQAARVAARRGDGAFFTAGEGREVRARLAADPATKGEMGTLDRAVAAGDWPAAGGALRRLLAGRAR